LLLDINGVPGNSPDDVASLGERKLKIAVLRNKQFAVSYFLLFKAFTKSHTHTLSL